MQPSDDIRNAKAFRAVDGQLLTSGQPSEAQLVSAAAEGVQVVINLALHGNPAYSLPDEVGLVRSLAMEYIHIPVAFEAPSEADLLAFFAAMDALGGRKALVHCAANKRVTAFLGLYRVARLGWDAEAAFAMMRALWLPDAVWSAFIEAMLARHGAGTSPRKS